MAGRFVVTPGAEHRLARTPEMLAQLRAAADRIAAEARRNAPRSDALPPGRRRHYVDGIAATAGIDKDGPVGRVNAFHFTSWWIEAGSVHNQPYAPLRRALDAMRGRL